MKIRGHKKSFVFVGVGLLIMGLLLNNNFVKAQINPSSLTNHLPQFLQNFIRNITNFSIEKVEPNLEKSGIEEIIASPTDTSAQNTFFSRVKNWLQGLSQEINQFFKVDVGSVFSKIMNLMIYGFNKGVEFIKSLFS